MFLFLFIRQVWPTSWFGRFGLNESHWNNPSSNHSIYPQVSVGTYIEWLKYNCLIFCFCFLVYLLFHQLFFRAMALLIPMNLIMLTLCALMGVIAYGYYASVGCDPYRAGCISNLNQVWPNPNSSPSISRTQIRLPPSHVPITSHTVTVCTCSYHFTGGPCVPYTWILNV